MTHIVVRMVMMIYRENGKIYINLDSQVNMHLNIHIGPKSTIHNQNAVR